jgi:hypothetical protein
MSMPTNGRITTTTSLSENQGQMCAVCTRRVPLVYIADGVGKVCPDCDPKKSRSHLIELVPDEPVAAPPVAEVPQEKPPAPAVE